MYIIRYYLNVFLPLKSFKSGRRESIGVRQHRDVRWTAYELTTWSVTKRNDNNNN